VLPARSAGSTFDIAVARFSKDPLMSSLMTSSSLERKRPESAGEVVFMDYRERRALEALEQAALKRQDCAEQVSTENSADRRIRAWEKVHQLRMPSAPLHPVLQAISAATQLTLAQVQHEQQQRSGQRASVEL
jgi:hypothetical protein